MLCAKFGWNWISGSGEDENVKSQQWQRTIDRFWSEKLSWNLKLLSIEYWLCIYNITYKDNFPYISFLPIVISGQKYYHLFK